MDKRYVIIPCIMVFLIVVLFWQGVLTDEWNDMSLTSILLMFVFAITVVLVGWKAKVSDYISRKGLKRRGKRKKRSSYYPNDESLLDKIKRMLGIAKDESVGAIRRISDIRSDERKRSKKQSAKLRKDARKDKKRVVKRKSY